MGNIRQTFTEEKHSEVFRRFEELLKEVNDTPVDPRTKVPIGPFVANQYIYERLSVEFKYSPEFVSKIVRKRLKGTGRSGARGEVINNPGK